MIVLFNFVYRKIRPPICVLMSILLMIIDGFTVHGPSGPLVVSLGSSVVLPCYVDKALSSKGLEVEWRRTDSETLVHLYQDGKSLPEAQQQDYHDRAHFFTDQIQYGNFSLRLDKLRAEDEGKYTCKVYTKEDSGETVVTLKSTERLLVSGSSRSISVSVGEDVTLNCSVDSHIPPTDIEEVSWKKTDEDENILVLLYQNNKALPEAAHEQYRDRVEFFTDEIPKGNFSLRLKSVRSEDKGVYMCQAFAGGLSANATVVLERLGFSVSHIIVFILCITASGSALLLCFLIYCRSPYKGFTVTYFQDTRVPLGSSVVLPCYVDKCLLKKSLKVEWRRTTGDSETLVHLYQDGESRAETQQQEYHDRAHFFTDQIQHGNFSLRLDNLITEDEGEYTCRVYSPQDCVFSTTIILELDDDDYYEDNDDDYDDDDYYEDNDDDYDDDDADNSCLNGFTVRGPSGPLVVPLRSSVVLPCSVPPNLLTEDLEVKWRRTDSDTDSDSETDSGTDSETLVHLYQDGESRPEKQHKDYHDRAHFFTDQIQHGNFSLRLDNLRAEDEGKYRCKVHSQQEYGESVAQIQDVERLLVSGSNQSIISASVGEDITLNCSVDSHITPEHIEEVSWKKTDEDILVLLYQNNETFPEAANEQYRDRVEFFTDEIPKGNFSLRLKSVRTEDKGVYMCEVFAGGLSANTTVVLERLGFSFAHIMVLTLCIVASGAALLLYIIIYCSSQNTDSTATKHVRTLGFLHVFLPNIMMFVAFVLWGVTEGFLYETVSCCALYILRPLMVISIAPYLKKMSVPSLFSEIFIFMVVYFSVLVSRAWGNIVNYGESEKITFIAVFGVVIGLVVLFIVFLIISVCTDEMECCGGICEWIVEKVAVVAAFTFFILPSLQFILLFAAFGAKGGGFFVTTIFPFLFFLSFSCSKDINKEKNRLNLLNITSWMIFMFIMTAVLLYFYITTLKNEKDGAGWTCTAVFVQVLWMIAIYIEEIEDLGLTLTFKKMLYVFGSVGVVLLNSVTLMTELILKTVHGERAVGDLRVVVFSSESIFAFSLMILSMFGPWISDMKCVQCCQKAAKNDDIPVTGSNQNQDSQNAAGSDEASASGSNQNTVELHVRNPLLNQDQEAGRE